MSLTEIIKYLAIQPGHLRSECPMNKESKKDKDKKKKAMMATWSDSDPSSSESELDMEIKANLYLMAIEDEVCIDDLNEFDKLQNEYECLFNDFEKVRHKCKTYKKIITILTLDIEKTKLEYDVVMDNKNELEKCLDNLKSENKALSQSQKRKAKHWEIA